MRLLILLAVLPLLYAGTGAISSRESSTDDSQSNQSNTNAIQSLVLNSEEDFFTLPANQDGYLIISNLSDRNIAASITLSTTSVDVVTENRWKQLQPISRSTNPPTSGLPSTDRIPEPRNTPGEGEHTRTFFIHVSNSSLHDPRGYEPVKSDLLMEGDQVRVYLDRSCHNSDQQKLSAAKIIQALDKIIIPSATTLSGRFADIDRDGKIAVLLTPCLDRMQGGQTSLNGFVRASDFDREYPRPFSNCADLIYINSECPPETNYLTLLAHEFWHVMQFSHRLADPASAKELQEDWVCEGTAHLAELRFGGDSSNLKHRISAWMKTPEQSPLVVPDYYSAGLWRHDGCRGGLFIFFRWCELQYGPTFLTDLLQTPGTGMDALEQVTGESFETLHQHSLVGILQESLSTSRPSTTADKILDGELFGDVSLGQLALHELSPSSTHQTTLKATASTYLKVTGEKSFRIRSDQDIPMRVLFVPKGALPVKRVARYSDSQVTR